MYILVGTIIHIIVLASIVYQYIILSSLYGTGRGVWGRAFVQSAQDVRG